MSSLILGFQEILGRAHASEVNATLPWAVAYFSEGPPPVVADVLDTSRRGEFHKELIKLSDVQRKLDARCILVSHKRRLGVDDIRIAASFGVYVVLDDDPEGLKLATNGAAVLEVNSRAISRILESRNRRRASECKAAVLALLREKWLTSGELNTALRLSFGAQTASSQLRSLARSGVVRVLGRTRGGEGIYGLPDIQYQVRGDLSRVTMLRHLKTSIIQKLASSRRPMSSSEISESLKVSRHQIRSLLKRLSDEGEIERTNEGWIFKGKA